VRYVAHISAKHKKGSSFDRVSTLKKQAFLRRSIRHYLRKHHGKAIGTLFWLLEPVFVLCAFVASLIKPI